METWQKCMTGKWNISCILIAIMFNKSWDDIHKTNVKTNCGIESLNGNMATMHDWKM
jgi:hypothetical protein